MLYVSHSGILELSDYHMRRPCQTRLEYLSTFGNGLDIGNHRRGGLDLTASALGKNNGHGEGEGMYNRL